MKIKKYKDFEVPNDSTIIWRYMELSQFLDLIVHKQIYFPNMNILTDKYEGKIPKNIIAQKENEFKRSGLNVRELEEEMMRFHYSTSPMPELTRINCWTMEEHESYALWKIYLKGSTSGVAIKTTVGSLKSSLENGNDKNSEDIYLGKVSYTNNVDFKELSRFDLVTTKMPYYRYENELRLIIFDYPISEGGKARKSDGKGRYIKINLEDLIDNIYISPFSSGWFYNTLIKTIELLEPNLKDKICSSNIQDC